MPPTVTREQRDATTRRCSTTDRDWQLGDPGPEPRLRDRETAGPRVRRGPAAPRDVGWGRSSDRETISLTMRPTEVARLHRAAASLDNYVFGPTTTRLL
jgi:hypothetical protein